MSSASFALFVPMEPVNESAVCAMTTLLPPPLIAAVGAAAPHPLMPRLYGTSAYSRSRPPGWRRVRSEKVWADALATLASTEGKSLSLGAGELDRGIELKAELRTYRPATQLCVLLRPGLVGLAECW